MYKYEICEILKKRIGKNCDDKFDDITYETKKARRLKERLEKGDLSKKFKKIVEQKRKELCTSLKV